MRESEVPQDKKILGEVREVCYAVDENGRYVLAESAGWEPANIVNIQAWDAIRKEAAGILGKVRNGSLSPLAYHMAVHQMDVTLLAGYAGLFRWQVRRHMLPGPFNRLKPELLERYGSIFRMSAAELTAIPGHAGISNAPE